MTTETGLLRYDFNDSFMLLWLLAFQRFFSSLNSVKVQEEQNNFEEQNYLESPILESRNLWKGPTSGMRMNQIWTTPKKNVPPLDDIPFPGLIFTITI